MNAEKRGRSMVEQANELILDILPLSAQTARLVRVYGTAPCVALPGTLPAPEGGSLALTELGDYCFSEKPRSLPAPDAHCRCAVGADGAVRLTRAFGLAVGQKPARRYDFDLDAPAADEMERHKKKMIDNPRHKYIKIFILLFLAGISYQGLLNIFPLLAMITYLVKEITEDKPYKEKEKAFFVEMIKLAVIVILVLLICMGIVKIGTTLLNSKQDRRMHLISFEAILLRGKTVGGYLNELWNECMAMLPKHTNTIVLILSFVLLIISKTKKEYIMQYLLIVFITFSICIVPMFIFNTGVCGRVNVPLMMLWGSSIIILLAQASISPKGKINNIIYTFTIISCIINSIFIMQNITEHIAANRVDENTGKTISYLLNKYESETGKTITKFSFKYDKNPQQYAVGIRPMQSLTERKFACSWCIRQAVNYYCNKNLKQVGMPAKIIEKFKNIDYEEFSEEQIIFDDDTLYMLIY